MVRTLTVLIISFLLIYCSPEHRSEADNGSASAEQGKNDNNGFAPGMPFSEIVEKVFLPSGCFDCHSKYKNYATMSKITVPGSPETSKLYLRASTDMPPTEEGYLPLTDDQVLLIRDWIVQGAQE